MDKVKSPPPRGMRVVSLRSMDTVDLLRLRSTLRYMQRQRDDMLRGLGEKTFELLSAGEASVDLSPLRTQAHAVTALDAQITEVEQRFAAAEQVARLSAHAKPAAPFLTVCACGAPLYAEDVRCGVCGRDVEALIRLASESKKALIDVACACGAPLVAGIQFCPQCGRSVVDLLASRGLASGDALRCPRCQEGASPGDRFCSSCGNALTPGG